MKQSCNGKVLLETWNSGEQNFKRFVRGCKLKRTANDILHKTFDIDDDDDDDPDEQSMFLRLINCIL